MLLLGSVNLLLRYTSYNVRSDLEDDSSHYNFITSENKDAAVVLCKLVMRPRAHDNLLGSALQFGQWRKMLSRARNREERQGKLGKQSDRER